MQCMKEEKIPKWILNAKPESKFRLGRLKAIWTDDIVKDAKKNEKKKLVG